MMIGYWWYVESSSSEDLIRNHQWWLLIGGVREQPFISYEGVGRLPWKQTFFHDFHVINTFFGAAKVFFSPLYKSMENA